MPVAISLASALSVGVTDIIISIAGGANSPVRFLALLIIIGLLLGGAVGFILQDLLHDEPAGPITEHRWPFVVASAVLGMALFTIGAVASGGWALGGVTIGFLLLIAAVVFAGYVGGSWLVGALRVGLQEFIAVFQPVGQNQAVPAGLLSDIAKPIIGFVAVYLYGILWSGTVFYCLYRSGIGAFSIATAPGVNATQFTAT